MTLRVGFQTARDNKFIKANNAKHNFFSGKEN